MADSAVLLRLNVIIVLLLAILAILLWPLLPSLLFYGILVLFVATAAAMVRVLSWTFECSREPARQHSPRTNDFSPAIANRRR